MESACDAFTASTCLSGGSTSRRSPATPKNKRRQFVALIPLTVPEMHRLLARLVWPIAYEAAHGLDWSQWRRRHQAKAMGGHHKSRGHSP